MIHLVFERPLQTLKAFHSDGSLRHLWNASGAAVVNSNGPMPQGHYILLQPEMFAVADRDPGTGWGRVRIRDMSDDDVTLLVKANLAKAVDGVVSIGGIAIPPGRCNAYERVIEVHGGGTALGVPACYGPMQDLCCTLGCTRMHNEDVQTLTQYMQQFGDGNTFVFSAIGAPGPCPC